VTLRLPRYRSRPLSCIRPERVRVDAEEYAADALRFRVGARTYGVAELAERFDEWWFILDDGELLVDRPTPLEPGAHDVEVSLVVRIPYVFTDGGKRAVEELLRTRKTLELEAAAAP